MRICFISNMKKKNRRKMIIGDICSNCGQKIDNNIYIKHTQKKLRQGGMKHLAKLFDMLKD